MPNAAAYKVFVGTWNVGAITPSNSLNLEDWLGTNRDSYDIYVLGFQEIVPLSTRNVLGPERNRVAMKWNSLIGATLNKCHRTEEENKKPREVKSEHHHKVYPMKQGGVVDHAEFSCIVSKQMVGILVSVWARKDLFGFIKNPCVSCVGCGIMGCLKNKGSVSVRFYLHEVSCCFVCCHLSSGEKEGDKRLRNLNLNDILFKTNFANNSSNNLPEKILDHDCVVLFGDLNYRLSLPTDAKTRSLVDREEWKVLLGKDQLTFELSPRGIFEAWNEGPITFPPTYKYKPNSAEYCWQVYDKSGGAKRRAPAWCDRILWIGKGLKQVGYQRCESKLSDHRPVRAIFVVDL